jgi:hypothetical protein
MVSKIGALCVLLVPLSAAQPQAHDIYVHLENESGFRCCNDQDCRPARYRSTSAGVEMFVYGKWVPVAPYDVQYRTVWG